MAIESELPTGFVNEHDGVTAVAHLYRAEMNRMLVWRQRLDVTSNWAVILATALTTFTLGSAEVPQQYQFQRQRHDSRHARQVTREETINAVPMAR